ncbi:hypothetical protein [Corallococcus exiguus]|uniref:hypothetical protein n=1 Tax=Corallococcus exiguus TaxID=83462 RepID=UPI003DA55599
MNIERFLRAYERTAERAAAVARELVALDEESMAELSASLQLVLARRAEALLETRSPEIRVILAGQLLQIDNILRLHRDAILIVLDLQVDAFLAPDSTSTQGFCTEDAQRLSSPTFRQFAAAA